MTDDSRRFTDREVALVLRRASEMDDAAGATDGSGMTLEDLRSVAAEVGISPASVDAAVAALGEPGRREGLFAAEPMVHKSVHAITGTFDQTAMARLVDAIDAQADASGTVTEALGSVRWTSNDPNKSTLVTITPGDDEATVQVVAKVAPATKQLTHFLPTLYAAIGSIPLIAEGGLGYGGPFAAVALVGSAFLLGRTWFNWLSRRRRKKMEKLAAELAREASGLATPTTPEIVGETSE